jgi:YesN/AraC family two-component response regulator
LLIDDDEVSNALTHQIIRHLNFAKEVKICLNGAQAVEYVKEFALNNNNESPELILIDITMPVMDGFEFIEIYNQLIFSNQEKVTQVILTSSSDLNNIRKAKKMGVDDYLIKPLTKNTVLQLLQHNRILV